MNSHANSKSKRPISAQQTLDRAKTCTRSLQTLKNSRGMPAAFTKHAVEDLVVMHTTTQRKQKEH